MNTIKNYKEYIGKTLFILSFILLFHMFLTPINHVLYFIDERFTVGLLNLSFNDMINIIQADVHPPLYYFILKFFKYFVSYFNFPINYIHIYKFVSIIPYMLIIFISFEKIRKDYNWFVAGLFVFTIGSITSIFIQFETIRMYSWSLLFLLLTFIYLKEVLLTSNLKSWTLFTFFFNTLRIYSQYTVNKFRNYMVNIISSHFN